MEHEGSQISDREICFFGNLETKAHVKAKTRACSCICACLEGLRSLLAIVFWVVTIDNDCHRRMCTGSIASTVASTCLSTGASVSAPASSDTGVATFGSGSLCCTSGAGAGPVRCREVQVRQVEIHDNYMTTRTFGECLLYYFEFVSQRVSYGVKVLVQLRAQCSVVRLRCKNEITIRSTA